MENRSPIESICCKLSSLLNNGKRQRTTYDASDRDALFEGIDTESATCVSLHDGECIENWTVSFVVGAKLQRIEKPNQHSAVVRPVGAPHDLKELLAISRTGCLELPYQISES